MTPGQRTKTSWWTMKWCQHELAKEEFVAMKMFISRMFKDKNYQSLWELMMTREQYCLEYKDRGFSSQKRIKSDVRASLHTDTVEDLIRISVEGPSLEDFDARECGKLDHPRAKGYKATLQVLDV
ncbi:hypothetical protein SKAU_G00274130 [Synaphobranchus kaupii]|uniref:Uncharacterized protein n=1 Tax=Synaphobranchus kaupii TaxID=118154 RepID=A0A9Q1IQW3_SYNKA|nr:hypothetical protein SKAU_G00274130 [Synaphobranchus kaupii]